MEFLGSLILFGFGSIFIIGFYFEFRDSIDDGNFFGIIFYGLMLSGGVYVAGFMIHDWYIKSSINSNFDKYIITFTETNPSKYNYSNNLNSYSKIIIIDKNEKSIHKYHFSLPKNRKAEKPKDVDAIVWLEFNEQFAGYYGTSKNPKKTKGYTQHCRLTLIDHQNNSIIAIKYFNSTAPDKMSYRSRRGSSAPKEKVFKIEKNKIIDYITNTI